MSFLSVRSVVRALRCPCAPLSVRSVVRALLMAASLTMCFLLAAPSARAGTYTVTYSGGQTVAVGVGTTPPGTTVTTSYSANYDGNSNYGGSAGVSWANRTASVTCSKVITATATWQPSDPNDTPPSSVIVKQVGTARWDGQGFGAATPPGKCDDGMGDTEVDTGTSPPQPGPPPTFHGVSTGTHWSVKTNPGTSFTLSPSPSASVSGTGTPGPPTVSGSGSASVSYAATIYPVTVTLVGQNASYQALCGQQITASLNCPFATVTGYHWAVSGNLIKTYNPSFGEGQVVPLSNDAGDFTGSRLYFYDVNNNDTASATCYANITLPDGTAQVASATSQTVTFRKPTAVWYVKEGSIQPFTNPKYPGDTLFGLAPDPSSKTTYPNGEDWFPVSVTVPSGFSTAGQCGFTQLATPNRTFTRSGTTTGGPSPQGLDNTFGFDSWTLPGQGDSGDNPSITTSPDTNSGLAVNDKNAALDKFTTYLMYMPAAVGSQGTIWVSLQSYDWSVTTTILWNGSQWQIAPAASSPNSPSASTIKGSPVDILPTWSTTYVNSQ